MFAMKPLRVALLVTAGCWFAMPFAAAEQPRTFTVYNGQPLHGELVGINGEYVTLKLDSGATGIFRASEFCAADLDYFKKHGLAIDLQSEPPELVARRGQLAAALKRAETPLLSDYLRNLKELKLDYGNAGNVTAAFAVDAEIARVKQELHNANNPNARLASAGRELKILSSRYMDLEKQRSVDTTPILRKALETGFPRITLNTRVGAGGQDPAYLAKKQTVIIYEIDGQRKEKTFPEAYDLNFRRDLE